MTGCVLVRGSKVGVCLGKLWLQQGHMLITCDCLYQPTLCSGVVCVVR